MEKFTAIKSSTEQPIKENFLKVEVRYNLGGHSYVTYRNERRGYYLHVTPVTREDKGSYVMESFTAFRGFKMLLKEVKRQSKKAEAEAVAMVDTNEVQEIIKNFMKNNNIKEV